MPSNYKAFIKFMDQFKRNEAINAHCDNTLMMAKLVGTETEITTALRIQSRQSRLGYLTPQLSSERDALDKALRGRVKAHFQIIG